MSPIVGLTSKCIFRPVLSAESKVLPLMAEGVNVELMSRPTVNDNLRLVPVKDEGLVPFFPALFVLRRAFATATADPDEVRTAAAFTDLVDLRSTTACSSVEI